MKTEQQNTYNYDQFSNTAQRSELKRLEQQALLVSNLEQSAIAEIGFPTDGRFIDIGCGPGFVTGEIARHYPHLKLIGLDNSTKLLDVASQLVQPNYPNLTFQPGDATHTGLSNQVADVVYSRLLYQHLELPKNAMMEAKRILKPGGKLCIVDVDDQLQLFYPELPSFKTLQTLAAAAQSKNGGDRHIGRKLCPLMSECGFKTQFQLKHVSTLDIGFNAFFDIVVSFKAQIIGPDGLALLEQLKQEVDDLPQTPFGMAGIPLAIGTV